MKLIPDMKAIQEGFRVKKKLRTAVGSQPEFQKTNKLMEERFIVSQETFYDEEKLLFGCYLGKNDDKKTLWATVWGSSPAAAVSRAEFIARTLNRILDAKKQ